LLSHELGLWECGQWKCGGGGGGGGGEGHRPHEARQFICAWVKVQQLEHHVVVLEGATAEHGMHPPPFDQNKPLFTLLSHELGLWECGQWKCGGGGGGGGGEGHSPHVARQFVRAPVKEQQELKVHTLQGTHVLVPL